MAKRSEQKIRSVWRKEKIDAEKRVIRKVIEGFSEGSGSKKERLNFILKRIGELADDSRPLGQLRRFIYTLSALSHHLNFGGLSPSQVKNLATLATAILKTQGVRPIVSRLAFLFGDLHLILSQIHWRSGNQWEAAWQQQLALYLSSKTASAGKDENFESKGLQFLGAGVRAMRLGHASLALENFRRAEARGIFGDFAARIRVEAAKTARLSGNFAEAEQIVRETLLMPNLSEGNRRELDWEHKCQTAQKTGDIGPLVTSVLRGKSHHDVTYLLEAFFWTRIVASRDWIKRFPTIRKMAYDAALDLKSAGVSYQCARALEFCYDYAAPYTFRLERVGKALSLSQSLLTMDQQLLVWAAAVRWLSRGRSPFIAELVLHEYQALSLRLTRGNKTDALGLLSDVEADATSGEREKEPATSSFRLRKVS